MSTNGIVDRSHEPTHYCRDCEERLALLYEHPSDKTVMCNNCGGTNTRPLEADDEH